MDRHRPVQDLKWRVKENYEKSLSLRCRRLYRRPPFGRLRASLVKKLKREGYWVRGVDIKER